MLFTLVNYILDKFLKDPELISHWIISPHDSHYIKGPP